MENNNKQLEKLIGEIALVPESNRFRFHDDFMEQFFLLTRNIKFQEEIDKIRKKWGIGNNFNTFSLKDNLDFIKNNQWKTIEVTEIANKCSLAKTKYRLMLIVIILNFIRSNKLVPNKYETYLAKFKFNSNLSYSKNNFTSLIDIKITINVDTKLSEINTSIKDNWKEIKKLQKIIKGERYTPVKDFSKVIGYIALCKFIPSWEKIADELSSKSDLVKDYDGNKILKFVKRIQIKIDRSFK